MRRYSSECNVVVPTFVITTFITKNRSSLLKRTVCVIWSRSLPLAAVPTQEDDEEHGVTPVRVRLTIERMQGRRVDRVVLTSLDEDAETDEDAS